MLRSSEYVGDKATSGSGICAAFLKLILIEIVLFWLSSNIPKLFEPIFWKNNHQASRLQNYLVLDPTVASLPPSGYQTPPLCFKCTRLISGSLEDYTAVIQKNVLCLEPLTGILSWRLPIQNLYMGTPHQQSLHRDTLADMTLTHLSPRTYRVFTWGYRNLRKLVPCI